MATLGYIRGSNGPDLAQIGANEQLVSHVGPNSPSSGNTTTGVFLAHSVSAWVGRWGGAAVMRFGGWDATSSSAAPGALLFRTAEISPTVNYMDGGGGQKLTASIIDGSNNPTIVTLPASQVVALGAASRVAAAGIAMYQASAINQPNEQFYRKSITGTTLVTAASSSASNQGQLAIQLDGVYNSAPNRPGAGVITAGGTTQRPTIKNTFSDPDESVNGVAYDRLETYRVEVWWGGVRRSNDVYTATTAERNGKYSERQVAPSIPWDTPFTINVFHRDRAGAESAGRTYSGTIFSGASIDTPTSPTGFVTNPANPGNIVAKYTSSGGVSANAVRVRLVNSAGSPIKTSGIIAKSVAPNANATVTWAESGFGTQPNDAALGVQMQARDTNGNWSQWSGATWIATNAAPDVPIIESPTAGAASPTLPELKAFGNDIDGNNGQRNVGQVLYCEILNASDVVLGTITATWIDWIAGKWTVTPAMLTSSGLITGHGTYKHRWYAYDGFLYSGGATTAAGAARSVSRSFVYAAVPSVTITGPASPVSTSQPAITWTCPGQTHWRVRGYDGARLVYDTGQQSGSALTHTISPSYWVGGEKWNNGEAFDFVVSGRDASTLWGDSAALALTLTYPPVDDLIIDGTAEAYPGMAGTHFLRVSTSVTAYPEGQFRGYQRRRVAITSAMGAEIPGTEITLPTGTTAGDTLFNDYHVISNQWYRYTVWQEIEIGNDIMESAPVSIDLMCSWYGVVLFSHADPSVAVWLKYGGPGGSWDPQTSETIVRRNVAVRGRRAALAVVSGQREATASGEHTFISTEAMSAAEQLARLYQVADWQYKQLAPNGRPNGICRRDGRGGSRSLMYATMNIASTPFHQAESVNLDFEEYDYDPYAEVR